MGANQSKHGGKKGKSGQTLGGGKDVLGGGGGESAAPTKDSPRNAGDARAAAAEAAERRMKAQQERGTNASNPKQGQLAAQARQNAKSTLPPPSNQKDDRLVWD
ncbi:hypothetical protein MD484_g213, partial [Candolleomyces efflorescens]